MMKKFLKILILPVAIITMFWSFSSVALADAPLGVQFVPNPLFNKTNFLPLDETSGTATVTNNSGATQTVLTEAINITDNNNLGSLLHLTIKENSVILFDNSLANFLSTAGEVSLGTISNGASKTFTYTVSFINSSDNSYQGKTLSFDVCVGFQGGDTHCGGTAVGGDDGGGSSGGSSGSTQRLIIFNEQALNITNVGASRSATITWNTNLLSTSQVVYGLASEGPYTLVLTPPDFGYPLFTPEDSTKVINHSMFLTGLIPGETYLYRVISRASPPTVSPEHQFTVPLEESPVVLAQVSETERGNISGDANGIETGEDATDTSLGGINSVESVPETEDGDANNLAAGALLSGFNNILSVCSLIALLILLIIYLIWQLWLRKKYEQSGMLNEEIWNKFFLFFGGSSLVVALIFILFKEYCPLPVFLISMVISLCVYAYRKLKIG
jgi:hypothetical protein